MRIGAVILAAGYSSRMGGFKPLLQLGGATLLARCATLFRTAGIADITVVTGHKSEEVEAETSRLNLNTIRNPEYDRGMFSSVCEALRHMQQFDGFFLLPVDIPLLYPATISRLLEFFDGRSVLIPAFCGEEGHPPLIPTAIIPAILAPGSQGEQGGLRAVLATQPCLRVPVWDRGILMDADTAEDFSALLDRFKSIGIGEPKEAVALATLLMPEKGVAHGLAAARIAMQLGRKLNGHGYSLNLSLLHNAALLHDIGKGVPDHETRGGKMLADLGLDKLAGIVAAHRSVPPPASGRLSEKEIVCLADKMVRGTRQISIQERYSEKLHRYGKNLDAREAIHNRLAKTLALQTLVEHQTQCSIYDIIANESQP